jgi:hypothetical protein
MDFQEAARDGSVIDLLRRIEDKLHERGFLVTATGDTESDVTIAFKSIVDQGENVPALVIAITSNAPTASDDVDWESISDYVSEKYLDLRNELFEAVQRALEESCGQYVAFNGRIVY